MLSEVLFILNSECGILSFMYQRVSGQIDWFRASRLQFLLKHLAFFPVSIIPLHISIFTETHYCFPGVHSDIPAVRGLCPVSKVSSPAAVAILRILLQERRCDWPYPFPLIRQMQALLQGRAGSCSCQPDISVTVLFQLFVNSIFLYCLLYRGYASRVFPE